MFSYISTLTVYNLGNINVSTLIFHKPKYPAVAMQQILDYPNNISERFLHIYNGSQISQFGFWNIRKMLFLTENYVRKRS